MKCGTSFEGALIISSVAESTHVHVVGVIASAG